MQVDESDPDKVKQPVLVLICHGLQTPAKKRVLNFALVWYSLKLVKVKYQNKNLDDPQVKAKAQYQLAA